MPIDQTEKDTLFRQIRTLLGEPVRTVELTDDQLCVALDVAIGTYSMYVQDWLVEHQWQSLYGQNITTVDMAFALSVRSLDYVNKTTYAYSKQVGLQSNGPWELKKDYVEIEPGRQVYQIPAGREINEVLWITPPATNQALLANYGGIDYGFSGGFAQVGGGGIGTGGFSRMGYYVAPAFDVMLMASDIQMKNKLIRSDLVYKITAGPNGTKLLHLLSTPGSRFSFGQGVNSSINLNGCFVWYFYYDTTPDNVENCLNDNPDVIKTPNQVPLNKLDYSEFNEPTKILIRDLFFAQSKLILAQIRGKFSGALGLKNADGKMDYEMLDREGTEEKKTALERLEKRLERLTTTSQLERAAKEATDLGTVLKQQPPNGWLVV